MTVGGKLSACLLYKITGKCLRACVFAASAHVQINAHS